MKINKYTANERQLAAAAASGGGSGSSTTIEGGGSASLDRTIWGQQDTGDDVDGSMTVNGNIHIKVIEPLPDEDDEEEGGTGEYEEYEEGGGNLEVDELTKTKNLEVTEDAYIKRHVFIHYPAHSDHPESKKVCLGEVLGTIEDNVKANKEAIEAETERAKGAEKDLSDAIKAETKRATDMEDVLDQNIQLCEQSIKNNADEIVALKNRTTANETAIANYLPVGSIIMYNGLAADIPEGWHICDGTNGTPNLKDKFIKASDTAGGTGGHNSIKLTRGQIPRMELTIDSAKLASDKEWKKRLNKYVPTLDEVGEYVFDKGGSTHYTLYTGYDEGDKGLLGVAYPTIFDDVRDYTYIGEKEESQSSVDIQPEYFALIFIMKIA